MDQFFHDGHAIVAVCLAVIFGLAVCLKLFVRRSFTRRRVRTIRAILNSLPCPVWLKDKKLRFIVANHRFLEEFALEQNRVIGKQATDIGHDLSTLFPESAGQKVLEKAVGSQVSYEACQLRGAQGLKRIFRTPFINEYGKIDGILGFILDHDEMRWNAEEKSEDGEKVPAFFATAERIGLLFIARGSTAPEIIRANRGAEKALGYSRAEIVKFPLSLCLAEKDTLPVCGAIRRLFTEEGPTFCRKVNLKRKSGQILPALLSLTPLYTKNGLIEEVCALFIEAREEHSPQRQEEEGHNFREEKIWRLAYLDSLTGLPNLSLLREKVRSAIVKVKEEGLGVALISLDIDRFKDINHSLGITRGDKLLQLVSQKLCRLFSSANIIVSRVEGDTFVVFLSRVDDENQVLRTLEHLRNMLGQPFQFDGQDIFMTASVGVAIYPRHGPDMETLFKNANLAMHLAKDRSPGTVLFYSQAMNTEALEQKDMEFRLRRALKDNEFELYYQPQVSLMTRRITGVEALIRWNEPGKGFISPEIFIPVAEKCGLIRPIGEWVLKTVFQHGHYWRAKRNLPLQFSVNLSGRQVEQPDLLEMVDGTFFDSTFFPNTLELELTESIFMAPVDVTVKTLRELKERGINLAIDDFGTGYSSLNYLKYFPIDRLKIDQSFVRDIVSERGDAAIVEVIIAMARALDIGVIAEGVETHEQLEFLKRHHCHEMQGYYFARPMPIDKLDHYFYLMKNGFSAKLAKKFFQQDFSNRVYPYP